MRDNVGTNKKGFTIIEVVLVLAIAGLIFLIVFLAVPALQRSRRDTQRRSDLSRFMAQLEQYAANNNGQYPNFNSSTVESNFISEYMDDFNDPSGGQYDIVVTSSPPGEGEISVNGSSQCEATDGAIDTDSAAYSARDVAAAVDLEQGVAYCQDNSG